jgi:predicted TIM-barrel fold metal-dependent hydrolase
MLNDPEGPAVDPDLGYVVDAHVHLFPPKVTEAIWRWFDTYGWTIRHKLHAEEVASFLLDRGVGRIVGLQYAHKPGIAAAMNEFMAELVRKEPRIHGLATVYPGEPDAEAIVRSAFAMGLRGVKLHCHVQGLAADDPALQPVYTVCQEAGHPVVIHAGREPRSDAYRVDPYSICHVDRMERVLRSFPALRICVPHLGANEFAGYARLLERYDNLWLDTTMALADYFEIESPSWMLAVRPERILYGSDFPNLPYAWDRELARIKGLGLDDAHLEKLLSGSADELYRFVTVPSAPTPRRA